MKKPCPLSAPLLSLTILVLVLSSLANQALAFTCVDVLNYALRNEVIRFHKEGLLQIGMSSFGQTKGAELTAKNLELILVSNPNIREVTVEKYWDSYQRLRTGLLEFFGLPHQDINPRIFRDYKSGELYLATYLPVISAETGKVVSVEISQLFLAQKLDIKLTSYVIPGEPLGQTPGESDQTYHGRQYND